MIDDKEFIEVGTSTPAGNFFEYFPKNPMDPEKAMDGEKPILTKVRDEDGFDVLHIKMEDGSDKMEDGSDLIMRTEFEGNGKKSYRFEINEHGETKRMDPQEFYIHAQTTKAGQSTDFLELFEQIKSAVDSSTPPIEIPTTTPNTPDRYEFITDGKNTLQKTHNIDSTTKKTLYCAEGKDQTSGISYDAPPQFIASSNGWSGSHTLNLPNLPAIPQKKIDGIKKWYTENLGSVSVAQIDKNNTILSKNCATIIAKNDEKGR